jgi:NAD(P)-dependent dehydrogenase (short-subunit alcohol dehydrogenase family)
MKRLEGKVAVVTGAASGIGLAIANRFINEGAQVAFTDIDEDGCRAAVEAFGVQALAVPHDVSNEESWEEVSARILKHFGRMDVLVNNAGVALLGDIETLTVEAFDKTMAVDLRSVFLGSRVAVRAMKEQRSGSIINTSSVCAFRTFAEWTAYNTAKAGIVMLTKSVALHCGKMGYKIRCNSVHPGLIRTPNIDKMMAQSDDPEAMISGYVAMHPIGRMGEPQDVAGLALYLASDEAEFVTGSTMSVDGGMSL